MLIYGSGYTHLEYNTETNTMEESKYYLQKSEFFQYFHQAYHHNNEVYLFGSNHIHIINKHV